jgi:hypothetical protein
MVAPPLAVGAWMDRAPYFCTGPAELRGVADTFESQYGPRFTAPDGTWCGLGDSLRRGEVPLYRVVPSTVFGSGKAPRSVRRAGVLSDGRS